MGKEALRIAETWHPITWETAKGATSPPRLTQSGINIAYGPLYVIITMMITRSVVGRLTTLLNDFNAVAILGPRQVGKTTLALSVAERMGPSALYMDLETPSDLAKLTDPESFFDAHKEKLIVLDEIQLQPGLFSVLRGVIDRHRRAGRRHGQFLLLGSATGELLAQSSESLAGRLAYLELTPFLVNELLNTENAKGSTGVPEQLWIRGGFPNSFLGRSDASSMTWRQQFISTYLERDIPSLGPRIPPQTLRRLWTMLAHEQAQLVNASKLAASLGVSGQTVGRYIDLLCDLMLVRRLAPWASNVGKRLVKSPKVYIRDSGLVHALLGLPTYDSVLGHPVAGGSWEGWVIENFASVCPQGTVESFYRTAAGAELDLVLDLPGGERWAIEVKRSRVPVVGRGFHQGVLDVKATSAFVVHSGSDTFKLGNGVVATSVADLAGRLSNFGA